MLPAVAEAAAPEVASFAVPVVVGGAAGADGGVDDGIASDEDGLDVVEAAVEDGVGLDAIALAPVASVVVEAALSEVVAQAAPATPITDATSAVTSFLTGEFIAVP